MWLWLWLWWWWWWWLIWKSLFSLLRQNQQQDRVLSWNWRLFRRQVGWKLVKFYHHSIFIASILKKKLAFFHAWKCHHFSYVLFFTSLLVFGLGQGLHHALEQKEEITAGNFFARRTGTVKPGSWQSKESISSVSLHLWYCRWKAVCSRFFIDILLSSLIKGSPPFLLAPKVLWEYLWSRITIASHPTLPIYSI